MRRVIAGTIGAVLAFGALLSAQAPQGRGGQAAAGGRGQAATPRAAAPIDLTGTWVSVVTEDWRWRMMTPPKGDFPSIPLNPEGRKVAEAWDPARDTAAGQQCKAYGAANIMRNVGRIRISWESGTTLKLEHEAGTQTRLFRFEQPPFAPQVIPAAQRTWQGNSYARWDLPGGRGRRGAPPPPGGQLEVVTSGMRAGYLQKNGVPVSENAVVTEYFNRTSEPNGDQWLIVTTIVEDPQYLNTRHARSSHFKKVADSAWTPTACAAS